MFSSIGLFNQAQCPEHSHCSLPNCIFSHDVPSHGKSAGRPKSQSTLGALVISPNTASESSTLGASHENSHEQDQPRKRRRLSRGSDEDVHSTIDEPQGPRRQPLADRIPAETESATLQSTATKNITPPPPRNPKTKASAVVLKSRAARDLVAKAEAAVKTKSIAGSTLQDGFAPATKITEVSLNPRMVHNPPASHAIRMQLVTLLHEQMARLNEEIWQSQDVSKTALRLSPQELVLEALAEEENIAKQNPAVYLNVIKLRITKLKKMKLDVWKEEKLKQLTNRNPTQAPKAPRSIPKAIVTGLNIPQEIAFLSKLLAKQHQLTKFGYVAQIPSEQEIAVARDGVEAAQGWEQCDRCKTRFQVFPGRREEDGALTSGGTCSYHPAKPRRPPAKDKADKSVRESLYACCNESVGTSAGCTKAATHVFKVSDPKRLSLVMPFKETPPELLTPGPKTAVCFDCEMGYTTMGLELIRLTATSWPTGEELLDVLVRPLGEILDLNSQFSGVWPADYIQARPYVSYTTADNRQDLEENPGSQLRLVESPHVARDLLFNLLTPETPLIGHALDNDLNTTRIVHPFIVDSVLLYPHPRGLPIRYGLKMLMKTHLDRDIQMGGANGHDSKEDARAAGDLVRLKVADTWKAMQRDGWTVSKVDFLPPLPSACAAANPIRVSRSSDKGADGIEN